MNLETTARRPLAFAAAFIAAIAIAVSAAMAFTSPALADDDVDYYTIVKGSTYGVAYGLAGEKAVYQAEVVYYDAAAGVEKKLSSATFKFVKVSAGLKATAKGSKLVVNKLPKSGKFKFTAVAYNKDGDKIGTTPVKVVVKKKPKMKIDIQQFGKTGPAAVSPSKIKKNARLILTAKNGSFAWDNNKKKSFCAITVKSLKTGKTAVFNPKTGKFSKNSFIAAEDAPGGSGQPSIWASFSKAGKYKVTMTIFHSDKKLAVATQTVTVK